MVSFEEIKRYIEKNVTFTEYVIDIRKMIVNDIDDYDTGDIIDSEITDSEDDPFYDNSTNTAYNDFDELVEDVKKILEKKYESKGIVCKKLTPEEMGL